MGINVFDKENWGKLSQEEKDKIVKDIAEKSKELIDLTNHYENKLTESKKNRLNKKLGVFYSSLFCKSVL